MTFCHNDLAVNYGHFGTYSTYLTLELFKSFFLPHKRSFNCKYWWIKSYSCKLVISILDRRHHKLTLDLEKLSKNFHIRNFSQKSLRSNILESLLRWLRYLLVYWNLLRYLWMWVIKLLLRLSLSLIITLILVQRFLFNNYSWLLFLLLLLVILISSSSSFLSPWGYRTVINFHYNRSVKI